MERYKKGEQGFYIKDHELFNPKYFGFMGMKWTIEYSSWPNGGGCLEISLNGGVGLVLLEKGNGEYVSYQHGPLLYWSRDDFKRVLKENIDKVRGRNSTGNFYPILVDSAESFDYK